MTKRYQYAIAACARWETDNLVEWLIYHRQIGFDHVYLYCNDDDPAECYERLLPFVIGPGPFVTFAHLPFAGLQGQMYKHFLQHHVHEVDWFIFLDIDEFMVFREDGTVRDFVAKHQPNADMVFFNWLTFGHSGFKERPQGSVLLNYTRRGRDLQPLTKVLTRTAALDVTRYLTDARAGFWHTWNFQDEVLTRALNVIGEDMTGYFTKNDADMRAYLDDEARRLRIIATAVIYHYQFRSEDELARRLRRGTGGDFGGQMAFGRVLETDTLAQFLAQFSAVEDTSLRDYWRYVLDASRDTAIVQRPALRNVALGKPATQSSISPWSRGNTPEEDAAGVVSGRFTGSSNCHTAEEDGPWWRVDLLSTHEIRQVRVFNRIDTAVFRQRASLFALETSVDGADWTVLYQTQAPLPFGGTDGQPLIWSSPTPRMARFLRFRLLTCTILHLEAVEIYEQPYRPTRVDPAQYGPLTERIVQGSRRVRVDS